MSSARKKKKITMTPLVFNSAARPLLSACRSKMASKRRKDLEGWKVAKSRRAHVAARSSDIDLTLTPAKLHPSQHKPKCELRTFSMYL